MTAENQQNPETLEKKLRPEEEKLIEETRKAVFSLPTNPEDLYLQAGLELSHFVSLFFRFREKGLPEDQLRELIFKAFEEEYDYLSLDKELPRFKHEPFYADLLEHTMRTITEKSGTWGFIEHYRIFKDHPKFEEVLKKAIDQTLEESDTRELIQYCEAYKDQPYFEEVLEKAIRKFLEGYNGDDLLNGTKFYKDQPYFEEILEKAARKAGRYSKVSAVYYPESFKDKPWAREVFEDFIKTNDPNALAITFEEGTTFKDMPWAKDIFMTAAQKAPVSALYYAMRYRDQVWVEEMVEVAEKSLKQL